jgi:hypothetical protein
MQLTVTDYISVFGRMMPYTWKTPEQKTGMFTNVFLKMKKGSKIALKYFMV